SRPRASPTGCPCGGSGSRSCSRSACSLRLLQPMRSRHRRSGRSDCSLWAENPAVGAGAGRRGDRVMDRRAFIAMVGGCVLTAPLVAEAQRAGKSVTVGYLGNSSPSLEANLVDAVRDGLRQLGYVEVRTLTMEFRR